MHFKPFQKPEKTVPFLLCPTLQVQNVTVYPDVRVQVLQAQL